MADQKPSKMREEPPAQMGCFMKLIGLCLVVAVGWWGYYSYRQGRMVNISDPEEQKRAEKQLTKDIVVAKEKSTQAIDTASELGDEAWKQLTRSVESLRKKIRGTPPEKPEDISLLVEESKKAVADDKSKRDVEPLIRRTINPDGSITIEKRYPNGPKPELPNDDSIVIKREPGSTAAVVPPSTLVDAQREYILGCDAYKMTDPASPSSQVQKYIRVAAPHFEKALDLCDKARAEKVSGGGIDQLEEDSAKRLYDCRKRMELKH